MRCLNLPTCSTQPRPTYILRCPRNMIICHNNIQNLYEAREIVGKCHQDVRRCWRIRSGGSLAAWGAPGCSGGAALGGWIYQAEGCFCAHLLAFTNGAGLWGWCFTHRLPLSRGTEERKRKNQRTRQALPGGNTNEDKFPLSFSKDFSSSYLISFQSNVSRDFNIFLLRMLASLKTLLVSLSPLTSPNA